MSINGGNSSIVRLLRFAITSKESQMKTYIYLQGLFLGIWVGCISTNLLSENGQGNTAMFQIVAILG